MSPLLSARDVHVHLRAEDRIVRAVNGVSIEVRAGECVGIIGESGSGKSTLGRAITRLLPEVELTRLSGEVTFAGQDVAQMSEARLRQFRRSGAFSMVFQDPLSHLNPTRRIGDQIAEAMPIGLDRRASIARSTDLLRSVGLTDAAALLRLYPHELSGGMRQRVLIAMSLAANPKMLIADEPTTALDATVQINVLDTLRRLNRESHLALLLITHDLSIVAELCNRVYVMHQGLVVEEADIIELFEAPKSSYTAGLISAARYLRARRQRADPGSTVAAASSPRVPVLSADRVSRVFRRRSRSGWRRQTVDAVSDISLDVFDGETLAIVGESGSGKSTMARMLLGLTPPSRGCIRYRGRDLAPLSSAERLAFRKDVQPVFQDPGASLNPRLQVMASLANVLARHGIAGAQDQRRHAADLLRSVGLDPPEQYLDRYPYQLSGGQQQRVAIARAMAVRPRLIIADEPLSSLDMSIQAQILDLLITLKRDRNLALVLISHDLNLVEAVADRVVVMYLGRAVEVGSVDEIFAAPRHDYTKSLLAAKLGGDPRARRLGADGTNHAQAVAP